MMNDQRLQIREFISKPLYEEKYLFAKDANYPKISIIIPSYNKGDFIEKTILSILNQNYPNLECIIIDGGSIDNTIDIIKKYDKYIACWVSEKDNGQSEALNKGFSRATGELVNEQDADDIFLPEAFLQVAELYKKNPQADIIFGNRLDIDECDNVIGEIKYTKFSRVVYRYDGMSIGPQSAFWKRELFNKIGMYDPDLHLAMDYEFFMRAVVAQAKFQYVPYCFSAMRRYWGSKTSQFLNTAPHKKEWDLINARYGKKEYLSKPLKMYALFYRTVCYILQGDGGYVWNGFKRRTNTERKKMS
jgi:glycosyltransferase involved in cell wall biosynthesis